MRANHWRLVEEIFQEAAEKASEERSRYLDQVCRDDEELRREVESLLRHEKDMEPVLRSAVSDAARQLPRKPDKYIGSKIGPYHVIRELSRGGMGVVYLAMRADQHYLQTVAIKLVRSGMDSEEIVSRFRHERQILANLNHPNIAAILDGGSTEDGLPYIVMEYVEGHRITEFCKSRELSLRERILLFRSVCLAVHYAHQQLVIHRDIKPGNILVTPDGAPKLLDFGIAKLSLPELVPDLEGDLKDVPLTKDSNRPMTPDYASPEQVLGEPLTTGADVYSLGVVLFELLTESRPYSTAGLPPHEVERVVCQESTSKPSEIPGLPRRIRKELRGDLDNIILMAMRKEPARRYKSAERLAEDLSRYLEGQPVIARVDTPVYRTGKFLRRHRTMVAAIAALFIALVAGALATVSQAHRAERRFTELQALVESVMFNLNDKIRNLPQSTEVRAALIESTLEYLDNLTKDPDLGPKLLIEISRGYAKVAEIQGSPYAANLGHDDQALISYEKALRIAQQAARQTGRDPVTTQLLIEMYHTLGRMQVYAGDTTKAKQNADEALRLAKTFHATRPADENRRQLLAFAYHDLASVQVADQQAHEALPNYRAALAVMSGAGSESSERLAGKVYNSLGGALNEIGPLSAALEAYRHAAEIRERLVREHPSNLQYQRELFVIDLNLGKVLGGAKFASLGDAAAASAYFTEARKIAEHLARLDSKNAQAKADLAFAYAGTGEGENFLHPDAAAEWYRKAIAITNELLAWAPGDSHFRWELAIRSQELAEVLAKTGRKREAISQAQTARDILVGLIELQPARKGYRLQLMTTHCLLCDLQRQSGDSAGASANREAAIVLLNSVRDSEPDLHVEYSLAKCYEVFIRVDPKNSQEWRQKSQGVWASLKQNGIYSQGPN